MNNWILYVECILIIILLLIRLKMDASEGNTDTDNEVLVQKQNFDSFQDTFVQKENIIRAVPVESGVIPQWLMQYNPTVVVLPELQVYIDFDGDTLCATSVDYIIYRDGKICVMKADKFWKTYTSVKIER